MPELQSVVSLPWRDGSVLQNIVSLPWRDGSPLQSLGSPYTPPGVGSGTVVVPNSLAAALNIDSATAYDVTHSLNVTDLRTGDPLPVESVTLTLDEGSMFWQLTANARYEAKALLEAGEQPAQVEVEINGQVWCFVVESMNAPRSFASSSVSFGGRSIAAMADAPYQFSRQWIADAPTTIAQIASLSQTHTGLSLVWQTADGLVPANVWSHQGSPVSVVTQCAEAIGAIVEAHQTDMSMTVTSRYPVMPNEWATTPPDVQVAWNAVESEAFQRIDQPAYNAIIVAGQTQGALALVRLAGTSGSDQAPMLTHPLLTDIAANVERGRSVLGASGKGLAVSRTLPVLPGVGVIRRGALVRWVDPAETWVGMARSISVRATLGEVRQTVTCERRTEFPLGTVLPEAPPPICVYENFIAAKGPYTTISGNGAIYTVAPDVFGETLTCATQNTGTIALIQRAFLVQDGDELKFNVQVTAATSDDACMMILSNPTTGQLWQFLPRRETATGGNIYPRFYWRNVTGTLTELVVGAVGLTIGDWYEVRVYFVDAACYLDLKHVVSGVTSTHLVHATNVLPLTTTLLSFSSDLGGPTAPAKYAAISVCKS